LGARDQAPKQAPPTRLGPLSGFSPVSNFQAHARPYTVRVGVRCASCHELCLHPHMMLRQPVSQRFDALCEPCMREVLRTAALGLVETLGAEAFR
jgi:hypothetical protein